MGQILRYNLSLNSFNPALGTLTDVSLILVTDITPEVMMVNLTASAQSFTNAQSTAPFSLNGPGSIVVTASASTGLINGTVTPPLYSISTFSGPTTNQTQTIDIASVSRAQYEGTGSIGLRAAVEPLTSSATFKPATLAVGGDAAVSGTVTIDYAYAGASPYGNPSSVPLPAAFLLFGPGLVGLGTIRRRLGK